ncbi:MAG: M55 family metallopeptidase [Theionarchaea archaeon]|nr:M55 family metallopeptidase [Theionarchaea archaeon]MBU7037535.1 M55 family metallopeptidase [Theionarchaea archaeon]
MKVYISADIEGISGVTDLDHIRREGKDYDTARMLMTNEVNAAVEGAFEGGASEVTVNDSHGSMINLLMEELDPRVSIISGAPKPLSMVQGVQGNDAAFFIGYHSKAGTEDAVMDHTYHGRVVHTIRVNGAELGELGINAALAGHFGVPVVLVSGDERTTQEAEALLGNVEVVATKEGIGRFAARNVHPAAACKEIKRKAQKVIQESRQRNPYIIPPPLRLEMDVLFSDMADRIVMVPSVERVSGRCVAYHCEDFVTLYTMMRAMILIASTAMR